MSSPPNRSADSNIIARAGEALPADEHVDLALMVAVAANDPGAQRILIERLDRSVRRATGLLSRTVADADDAAQLALIEILNSADTFRVAASLERWAERITIRTTLRALRRENSRKNLLERWLPTGMLPWGGPLTQSSEGEVGVGALLQRLSQKRSEAFVLHHAFEYTVEEIAELTGSPVGTIKDRLVAARKQLRKLLRVELRHAGRKLR